MYSHVKYMLDLKMNLKIEKVKEEHLISSWHPMVLAIYSNHHESNNYSNKVNTTNSNILDTYPITYDTTIHFSLFF